MIGETITTCPYSSAPYIARSERPLHRPTAANQSAPRRSISGIVQPAREGRDDERGRGNRVADDDDSYRVRPPFKTEFDDRLDHPANGGRGHGDCHQPERSARQADMA